MFVFLQGSADSNYSQPSSDLSLDEDKEALRRETERQALRQLEKVRGGVVTSARRVKRQRARCSTHQLSVVFGGGGGCNNGL